MDNLATVNQICPRCHEILVLRTAFSSRIRNKSKAPKNPYHVYVCPQCDYCE